MRNHLDQKIQNIFKNQPITVLGCGVYRQDLQSLRQSQWLRTEAITLLCLILQKEYNSLFETNQSQHNLQNNQLQIKLLPCKIISPLITSMILFMGNQDYILQSMEAQNLFQYHYLLIPCNTETQETGKGSHWFLMIYDTMNNCMYTMDSAYQCIHTNAKVMGQRILKMRKMFKVQSKMKQKLSSIVGSDQTTTEIFQKLFKQKQFEIKWLKNVVKQENSYDCGIYVVGNIERIFKKLADIQINIKEQKLKNKNALQKLKQYQITISQIEYSKQFFKDLRLRYFNKALEWLEKSIYKQETQN